MLDRSLRHRVIIDQILICDSWDTSALVARGAQNAALIHSQNPERCATTISEGEGECECDDACPRERPCCCADAAL
jgi:hypothetical protein